MVRHLAPAAEPPPMEREILAALLDEPGLIAEYAGRIPLDVFRDVRYRGIYETLVARGDLGSSRRRTSSPHSARTATPSRCWSRLRSPIAPRACAFQDSAARRAHLDRVVEGLMEGRLEARRRELTARQDAAFVAGQTFLEAEKDELARLVEELNQRKKKRLGAR